MFLEKVWGKTGSKIYGPKMGGLPGQPNSIQSIVPREDVVFIANDWHTALLPCYLKTKYKSSHVAGMTSLPREGKLTG
ncbi:hypothetical protein LOK49_LG10G02751 [Camellia lanceoleosa]|uniref:Uncharacterized protein n=1 Tax=Camellia lanceoleosa TaxID=1840588 RepID=A0ACC0G8A4_9ERIC|nr:hypothetical protein LOK49_LG10G02751 [Camellia lanceoleosa]